MSSVRRFQLALESSSSQASVSLGCGPVLLETVHLSQLRRHNLELMPAVAQLLTRHGGRPGDLDEVYISIGPGSFSGLRVGVTTAKMLAVALGVRLVAVPSIEVLAQNVPAPPGSAPGSPSGDRGCATSEGEGSGGGGSGGGGGGSGGLVGHLAVGLNLKRQTLYGGVFGHDGKHWRLRQPAALATVEELLSQAPRPVLLLAQMLPEEALPALASDPQVTVLPVDMATPSSAHVWRIGRELAEQGQLEEPLALTPLYVRPPEAAELWKLRKSEG